MIYKREEFIEEAPESRKFPVKQVEVLTPIDGGKPTYVGHLTIGLQTPVGVQHIPVNFEIDGKDVRDAFAKFESLAEPQIEETRRGIEEEISRMRQEAGNRIVRPDEVGMSGLGGLQGGQGNVFNFRKP